MSMMAKESRPRALLFAGAVAAIASFAAPVKAQTAAELQLLQACGGNLVACANVAQQLRAYQAAGGASGLNQVMGAAAAAANAARGQTINPAAYGASSVVTPSNSVGGVAAAQQYGQCVQAAGQNASAAQACMRYLPPEWAALAQQAQAAYLANPQAMNQNVQQVMANAQAVAAGAYGSAQPLQGQNPFSAATMQATADMLQRGAATGVYNGGTVQAPQGNNAALVNLQVQYAACLQRAGANMAALQACNAMIQQPTGGTQAYAAPQAAYNPVNNSNAILSAAGSYQTCVISVGVTNTAGIQACQARYLAGAQQPGNTMFGGQQAAPPPAPAQPAAAYNPFAAMMGGR